MPTVLRSRRLAGLLIAGLLLAGLLLAALGPGVVAASGAAPTLRPDRSDGRVDPSQFTTRIDNPWFPLVPGTTRVYEGTSEGKPARNVVTVTARTRRLAGVDTVVVRDDGYVDGRLDEHTFDYFAQDARGTVWYFGEDTAVLDAHGRVVSREGTWHAGRHGARPGVAMEAAPVVGKRIRQEYLKGHAEDWYRVVATSTPVQVPYGAFDALETREWTPLEPKVLDRKTYARGVGELSESTVRGPREELSLVEVHNP
ncbi:MAG TPA: hypothetical protein VFC99_16720 [Acidimicrobiia bacterium]|nr:hypothetical protein [Acidimicrobiia bacterium]